MQRHKVAIIGGGPAGLFMYKRLLESGIKHLEVSIFEKGHEMGAGMPYSEEGACEEHVTNVSGNEIPEIVIPLKTWIERAPADLLGRFNMQSSLFNDYKVLPRLLFGRYLSDQFSLLKDMACEAGVVSHFYTAINVTDIEDCPEAQQVKVYVGNSFFEFDAVAICIGHHWPKIHEGKTSGWFDSPYPPVKLKQSFNFPVAIRGASLTAIDAVRTLARYHGKFIPQDDHLLSYQRHEAVPGFQIVLHALDGLMPGLRFHLDDTHLSAGESGIRPEEASAIMEAHDGFIPLDYIFDRNFKQSFREAEPAFYESIKDMTIETFVSNMMSLRHSLDPFTLFKAEYAEAAKSIRRHESVYWKERLAVLSYAMNYPAKHLSAEDMLRLRKTLMPLISIIIAFVPQNSARELLALHEAGVLSIIAVDKNSSVEPQEAGGALYRYTNAEGQSCSSRYNAFIDAIGQKPMMFEEVPFASLRETGTISPASLKFKDTAPALKEISNGNKAVKETSPGHFYLEVPGVNINDHFQVLDKFGQYNDRLYMMAVPYIAGLNPDYSGLDFCETASLAVMKALQAKLKN